MEMLGLPSGQWSGANRLLAQALTLHDKDLCPCGCGYYLDETSRVDGYYRVETLTCDAGRARDQFDKDNERREPGEIRFVVRD